MLIPNSLVLNPLLSFPNLKPNSTLYKPYRVLKNQSLSKRLGFYSNGTPLIEPHLGFLHLELSSTKVKASKSLVEDEAGFGDWVSEFKSDLFRSDKNSNLYDDSGELDRGSTNEGSLRKRRESDLGGYSRRGKGGNVGRGRVNRESGDSFLGDSRGNGRFSANFEGRRENSSRGWGRESASRDYGVSGRGRGRANGPGGQSGTRNYGMSSRGRGGNVSRGWGRVSDSNDYGTSSRGRGALSTRGRGGSTSRARGNWDSNDDGRGDYSKTGGGQVSNGNGRGSYSDREQGGRDTFELFSQESSVRRRFGDEMVGRISSRGRGGRGPFESFPQESRVKERFGDDIDGRNERFMSPRKGNGSRGKSSFMGSRGGRGSDLGFQRGEGGDHSGLMEGYNSSKKGGLSVSDLDEIDSEEEDTEDKNEQLGNVRDHFQELLIEDDSDVLLEDDEEEVFKSGSSFTELEFEDGPLISLTSTHCGSDSYLSETRFDQCSISSLSLKAIKDAGYEKMTIVQEQTLPFILKGKDVLAKARTGTGKTVAFLLPSIEVVSKSPPFGRDQTRPPILVLVICPTRELACQAASEANKLLKYHSSIGVQVVIGGTRLALEQKRMQANPCQILVATPGRLKDHIGNTVGFATRVRGVKVLVLDEADHLLDMGFRRDIEKIIAAVPKDRQTLLFSATVPQEVRQICHIALKRDHEYINTIEEGSEETHAQVRQTQLVAPLDMHFPLLYVLLKEHIANDVDYKVLVFCTTAMVTRFLADLLRVLNLNVREIHSRKPQSYRTKVSDEFRNSKGLILVTSDVSARGVDYPDVSLVIQVGLPSDKEQYIHRLGRTGRKGKEGQGILLLAPWEEFFLSTLADLPISKTSSPLVDSDTKKKVEKALSNVEMKNKEAAYQAWLGYYNSNKNLSKDKCRLVELANDFSRCMGLDIPPAISKLVVGKMGLKNVPGLRYK